MNQAILTLAPKLRALNPSIDVVICHQITDTSLDADKLKNDIESIRPNIQVIQRYEKGLSKSRNCAIDAVKEGICIITDDDVVFPQNFESSILDAYGANPDADIITFQAQTPDGEDFKHYNLASFTHTQRSVARVSSIEITFKVDAVRTANVRYDEAFGLGSTFATSEEYIFLSDALKRGLKAVFIPQTIAIHPKESSGGAFIDNPELIEAKGATFYRVFGAKSIFVNLAFALKKFKQSNYSFYPFYTLMQNGAKKYQQRSHNEKWTRLHYHTRL